MTSNLTSSLQKYFGFTDFRPGQEDSIRNLLSEQHTLVVMPTGSGKSLIYQLTAMLKPGIVVVISPLIALMKDQVDSLERRGIPATFINSTLATSDQKKRLQDIASGNYRLIYVAPERLRNTQFINAIQHQKISLLAVDEAHCISEWGHDFRPDYMHIGHFRTAFGNPLTVALTATATLQVQDDIARQLGLPQVQRIVTGFNRPNLALEVQYVQNQLSRLKAVQLLLADLKDAASIVYTGTRRDAEDVSDFIRTVIGLHAQYYHAGLPTEERTRIQNEFMAGDLSIVAATNAFGMGIDRPDVRQVIHFSMPGSLEAYYQEAGRAGRDELPAKAILLYSPEDRSLQEWFIANTEITIDDLRLLFHSLRPYSEQHKAVTLDDISLLTGMQEVKVRVGLAELERAGVLDLIGDEGLRKWINLHTWKNEEIQAIADRLKQHQTYRKTQLDHMITYAETNTCRRKIILKHFGDHGPADADICCDNCQASQPAHPVISPAGGLSQSERVALIVLDAILRLPRGIGKEKLIQILKGSRAKDILKFGYDKSTYYGRLASLSTEELKRAVDRLIEMKYLKVIGGNYPILRVTNQGEIAIRNKAAIDLGCSYQIDDQKIERKKEERQAGGTLELTAQLLSEGLSVDQIAARRGLALTTIYSHAAKLIAAGQITVDAVVADDVQQRIESAIRQVGSVEYLYPIKILLPDEIEYNVIRCVVEGWKLQHLLNSASIPDAVKSNTSKTRPDKSKEDPVAAFLSQSHPRPLLGPWQVGWALDFNSQFSGANWNRSKVGEFAYRLKYQGDSSVLPELVELAVALIADHPELAQVDAVTPVPPSTPRPIDPVSSFAMALAERLDLAYFPAVVKSRRTVPQKEIHTLAQKHSNVTGAFGLESSVGGKRMLIVDDLFDSGATLEEITRLVRRAGAAKVCVLTLTRTIHSDA